MNYELRVERAGWQTLAHQRTRMDLPVPLAGSRWKVTFEARREGLHAKLGQRSETIAWTIEVARIDKKWRIVRLRR